MRRFVTSGLALWMSLAIGCTKEQPAKPTREDCTKVASHIADLIIDKYATNTDELWDDVHAQPGDTGITPVIDKPHFKMWLDSPEGRTWMMARRGQTLAGTQQGIAACVEHASRAQVDCLLASKSKEDVIACDEKRSPTPKVLDGSVPSPSGSAQAGSAEK